MSTISHQRLAETFVQVADTLVDEFDLIDFLTLVTERAAELAGAAASGLLLSDEQGRLQFMAASTESAKVLELFQVQQEEGPCQDCFRDGVRVSHRDLTVDVDGWPRFAPRAVAAGFRSVHAFPLRHHQTLIGALNVFDAEPRTYSDEESVLLQALADVAAIGILQERAIRRGELLTEQLQRALNSRITIEQAKGALAQMHGTTPDVAFDRLREYSRSHHQRLTDVAAAVLTEPGSHPALTTLP
ncbi:GAF and ANTAR domain-containing protein [Pedococcus ginsenosidimutans]|uniref:GAF and ANTAR domain-containing protein n=1 Tax=Pedococcus ginsenosidimutans TaxID=490570 RepID=A0ABP8YG71_9MICO